MYLKKKKTVSLWLRFEGLIFLGRGLVVVVMVVLVFVCSFCLWVLWDLCSGLRNPLLVETIPDK